MECYLGVSTSICIISVFLTTLLPQNVKAPIILFQEKSDQGLHCLAILVIEIHVHYQKI